MFGAYSNLHGTPCVSIVVPPCLQLQLELQGDVVLPQRRGNSEVVPHLPEQVYRPS
jgi:hypothetical protein